MYGAGMEITADAPQEGSMIPALIAGGASLLGGVMANTASARQASKQMRFQERMSSTAHQREVGDLRAAGLNPILSGTGGMGSASSAGAMAQQHDVLSPAVGSAQSANRLKQDISLMEAQESNIDENSEQTALNNRLTVKYGDSLRNQELKNSQATEKLIHEQENAAKWLAALHESDARGGRRALDRAAGDLVGYGRSLLEKHGGVTGLQDKALESGAKSREWLKQHGTRTQEWLKRNWEAVKRHDQQRRRYPNR